MNTAWRNGPVEDIHAGGFRGYPLDVRRISPGEERSLMESISNHVSPRAQPSEKRQTNLPLETKV